MNIRMTRSCGALAAAALCTAAFGANHISEIAWAPDGRFTHKAWINAGRFVAFNIHHHVGKEAVFSVEQAQASTGRDTMLVTVAQDYCWMWTNKGCASVILTVDLAR